MLFPTIDEIARVIDTPSDRWLNNCHGISRAVVRSGLLGRPGPGCRVVRGIAAGLVGGQHSWVCLGTPYDPAAVYVDPTIHCWDNDIEGLYVSTAKEEWDRYHTDNRGHVIHGYDPRLIWKVGRPAPPEPWEEGISLDASGLSSDAQSFLELLGPLTVDGWHALSSYPQGGWPYREVIASALRQVPRLRALVPIDFQGMVTDENPKGLYW